MPDIYTQSLVTKFMDRPFDFHTFDCFDLIIQWYKELGFDVPDLKHRRYWNGEYIKLEDYYKIWEKATTPETNNVIFMKGGFDGTQYHLGICLGDGTFVHVLRKIGVVVSPLKKYENMFLGYYRLNPQYKVGVLNGQ